MVTENIQIILKSIKQKVKVTAHFPKSHLSIYHIYKQLSTLGQVEGDTMVQGALTALFKFCNNKVVDISK